jgi:hypothetical protein
MVGKVSVFLILIQCLVTSTSIAQQLGIDTAMSKSGISELAQLPKVVSNLARIDSINATVDSVKIKSSKALQRIDSLNKGYDKITSSAASVIHTPLDSVNKSIAKIDERTGTIAQGANNLSVESKTKINDVSGAVEDKLHAPGLQIPTAEKEKLNSLSTSLTQVPGTTLTAPVEKLEIPLEVENLLPDYKVSISDVKAPGVPSEKINIPGVDPLTDRGKELLEGTPKNAQQLEKVAEDKIFALEPVNDAVTPLQNITAQQAEYAALIQKYKDTKALEKEMIRKASNVVNEQINQHSEVVKQAQATISKAKRLNPVVQSFKELKKLRTNEMKGVKAKERFIPGLALGTTKDDIFHFNLGAEVSYKLTHKFFPGAGVYTHFAFSENYQWWFKDENIIGYRLFMDYETVKSIYLHIEWSRSLGHLTVNGKESSQSANSFMYAGIGRRYQISKRLSGSVLLLYQDMVKNEISGLSKISTRITVCFDTKKRTKLLPPPKPVPVF